MKKNIYRAEFVKDPTWKWPNYLLKLEQKNKLCYTFRMEYYGTMEKTNCSHRNNIGRSHRQCSVREGRHQKSTCCMILFMWIVRFSRTYDASSQIIVVRNSSLVFFFFFESLVQEMFHSLICMVHMYSLSCLLKICAPSCIDAYLKTAIIG